MRRLRLDPTDDRTKLYLRYRVEAGMTRRYGADWASEPERVDRLSHELGVIERQGFASYFVILADIMDFCRETHIPYGPGRGSVGGCYTAFALGIHEVDSLEWDLLFGRFLTEDRVTWPDVDLDFSQRRRPEVLNFIRKRFQEGGTVVLQVAAFARAGGRSVIDMVASATEDQATGQILRKYLPEGNITGGTKQDRELQFWLSKDDAGKQVEFLKVAGQAGWLDHMLKLDGIQTHLAKHAAGVVILSAEDLRRLPQCGANDTEGKQWRMLTGYDMYALEDLNYLKIDALGLRTLDIIADAHKLAGGSGDTPDLIRTWERHRDDPDAYRLLCDADTLGVFQVETSGYRHTLKAFQPSKFDHIVQLNALYRPGALDAKHDDGKRNMVEVFIDRRHDREGIFYPHNLTGALRPILDTTQGIVLYQEQAMKIARELAGFNDKKADALRKAIGKKQRKQMDALKDEFYRGIVMCGNSEQAADWLWGNIVAAARYSWNKSHAVEYATITWLCAHLKVNHPAAFYTALINSWSEKQERQSEAIAEARQHVKIRPPDINLAKGDYTVVDGEIVFGLNGIKGMGEANRDAIIFTRELAGGPFINFEDFCKRAKSVPINMKLSLIRCGAFDSTDSREILLAQVPTKGKDMTMWTVAEHIRHNLTLKNPRELPSFDQMKLPTQKELAKGELDTIGFYVSADPMADVTRALARLDGTIHWGGSIESVQFKRDRNNNEMAKATLLTNGLNKLRLTIFASVFPRCMELLQKEQQVIVRGRMDDNQILVDALFAAGDYRHFKIITCSRNGDTTKEPFDGELRTVELAESSGYTVQLL